jgi:hypothetical protein
MKGLWKSRKGTRVCVCVCVCVCITQAKRRRKSLSDGEQVSKVLERGPYDLC